MKKTQKKDAVRNIRKRLVSYLSICLVIMLGLGGTFITSYMSESIKARASSYYAEHNFKNYELLCSLGVTDDDIAQIKATEGVVDAEGVVRGTGTLTMGDLNFNVELISMTERISVPEVVEGKAPEAKNECMIGEDVAAVKGLKVGDKVRLAMNENSKNNSADSVTEDSGEDGAGDDAGGVKKEEKSDTALLENEFTITGLMKHPDYFRRKSIDTVVLPWAAYNEDYLDGLYSHAFVRTEDPEGVDILSNKYFSKTAETKQRLDDLSKELEIDSLERTKAKAYATLDKRWQEALDELEKGQNEIDQNEANLEAELAKARQDLIDAQKELDLKVADAEKKIKDGEKKIKASEKKLENGEKEIKAGEKEIKAGEKKIKDGEEEIKAGEKKIKDGEEELAKAKEELKFAEDNLPEVKKYIEEQKALYNGELDDTLSKIAYARTLIDKIKQITDPESEEFKTAVMQLAKLITDHEPDLYKIQDFCNKQEVLDIVVKIRDLTKIDGTGVVKKIGEYDIKSLIWFAGEIQKNGGDMRGFVTASEQYIEAIENEIKTLEQYEEYIKAFEEKRSDIHKLIADKEKELEAGKKELAAAKKELEAGKKELAAAKKKLAAAKKELAAGKKELAAAKKKLEDSKNQLAAEKKKHQAEIRDGWNMYYAQKDDFEKRLEEAKALLAENREEAEAKFAELRADVENIECKWLVLDRRANAGYVDVKSTTGSIKAASMIFGILFMLISAIVCFSTLSIIIEEQKKMVGTVKAFGFLRKEILGKYMVFGVSAGIIGSIAGILMSLGASGFVLKAFSKSAMYQFGVPKTVVNTGLTIGACAVIIAVCALATVIACSDILKSPASILMKGGTSKKTGYRKSSTNSSKSGSLYSRLIIRNMLDDKIRVVISVVIIAFSTLLVGVGITMKLAFEQMPDKQLSDVYKYDVRVNFDDGMGAADREEVENILDTAGTDYTMASYTTQVFRLGDRLDALNVIAGNKAQLGEFFAVRDCKTGEAIELPEDGVLTQLKMKESYGLGKGSEMTIFSLGLDECNAEVKGVFDNHVGRTVVTSVEGYKKIFGEDPPNNCCYVKLNGADLDKLESDLGAVNNDISFEESNSFVKKFESVTMMYDLIVFVATGIAILMSFMILSNLANIFLNRKKTELTVMRINGFSIKQTKGYLARETVITTLAGVVLGVLAGAIATPFVIRNMEQPDIQFVRDFHVLAWVIAVSLEVLFSIIINSFVFRKVKDLNFRDVQ